MDWNGDSCDNLMFFRPVKHQYIHFVVKGQGLKSPILFSFFPFFTHVEQVPG